ncbi:hypothetical protein AAFF_G00415440 [Aldrovandia affinis]|uniref:Uncharacterized protein n=1 Tax=Aldrovandia affinis TaxID=143900 RepID=A0AAD7WJP4_9TELE|nr:hypothetical protein AAFF_G00415440 [Aldrovandia affinis]
MAPALFSHSVWLMEKPSTRWAQTGLSCGSVMQEEGAGAAMKTWSQLQVCLANSRPVMAEGGEAGASPRAGRRGLSHLCQRRAASQTWHSGARSDHFCDGHQHWEFWAMR